MSPSAIDVFGQDIQALASEGVTFNDFIIEMAPEFFAASLHSCSFGGSTRMSLVDAGIETSPNWSANMLSRT